MVQSPLAIAKNESYGTISAITFNPSMCAALDLMMDHRNDAELDHWPSRQLTNFAVDDGRYP